MHQVDERVPEAELRALTDAYERVITTVLERLQP
jgi:succinyl-diaminopimelate desuccinylase